MPVFNKMVYNGTEYILGGGGNIGEPLNLTVTTSGLDATITWEDNEIGTIPPTTFQKSELVRKIGSAPTSPSDGTLVVTETVKDTYKTTGYVDQGLTDGETYYYRVFSYSDLGGISYCDAVSVTPSGGGLPSEYQEVEYIENTSSSYLNSGLIAKSGYRIDFKFYTSSSSNSDQTIIGPNLTQNDCLYRGINYSGQNAIYRNYGGSFHDCFNTMYVGNTYEASSIIRSGHQELILNGVSVQSDTQVINQTGTNNLMIFCRGTQGVYALIKLYYMQVYDTDDTLLRDFVPCYRKADQKIGMYDLVNNVFYTNQGGGTFTKGSDV